MTIVRVVRDPLPWGTVVICTWPVAPEARSPSSQITVVSRSTQPAEADMNDKSAGITCESLARAAVAGPRFVTTRLNVREPPITGLAGEVLTCRDKSASGAGADAGDT